MKWMFAVLCLLAAATASGQSIYKCRDAKGGLVYQSDPCPGAEKRWDVQPGAKYGSYAPDDQMSAAAAERRIAKDRYGVQAGNARRAESIALGGSGASLSGRSGAVIGPSQSVGCQAAKSSRQAIRNAAGVHLSYGLASATDRTVFDACK
jgi:hypothetical protein